MSFHYLKQTNQISTPLDKSRCKGLKSRLLAQRSLTGSRFLSGLLLTLLLLQPLSAVAIVYQPGATLDPACLPTDTSCGVTPPTQIPETGLNLTSATTTPSLTDNQLYNLNSVLYWGATALAGLSAPVSLSSLNGLATSTQTFAVGSGGTDFNIVSSGSTHTFNIPTASSTARGLLSSTDWATFNSKENAITASTTATYVRGDKTFQTLDTSVVPENGNIYYTATRFNTDFALKTTNDLTEGLNLYFTDARARNAISATGPLSYASSTGAFGISQAGTSTSGYLSSVDWNTFNNKLGTLLNNGLIWIGNGSDTATAVALSGDATISNSGVLTLASSGVAAGAYGSTTTIPIITVDNKGRIINASATSTPFLISALTTLNGLTASTQTLAAGANGTDFNIISSGSSHTFNLPNASAAARGLLTAADWTTFNNKENAITASTTLTYFRGDKTFQTLDTSVVSENGNVYYTNARFDNRFASKTTSDLTEGVNLYYTDARARNALSATAPISYSTSTGAFSLVTGNITAPSNPEITIGGGTGAVLGSGVTIIVPEAGATTRGLVSTATQTFAGNKMFSGNVGIGTSTPSARLAVLGSGPSLTQLSGTVSVPLGSLNLTGVNTFFTTELTVGDTIVVEGETFMVANIFNDNNLELNSDSFAAHTNVPYYKQSSGGSPDILFVGNASGNALLSVGASGGLTIASVAPASTANTLYNQSGALYWSGSAVATTALNSGLIWVGNGSNVATAVPLSGDATISNAGALTIAADAITSGKILDGTIVNADINSSAAIALSKLASGSSIVTSLTTPTGSNANGGSITSNVLTLSLADGANPGLVGTSTQTFAGAKTFSSAPTFSSMTAGSVYFAGMGGLVSQDNSNLFWDNTNSRLGIGTSTPAGTLHVANASSANALVVAASGNVGIGTATPSDVLTVNGNLKFLSQATTIGVLDSTAGTAPALSIVGATNPTVTNGIGGAVNIRGGTGGTNLSTGGPVNITSGSGLTGGAITLQGSNNIGGGTINVISGTGALGGNAGNANITAGGNSGTGSAGSITLTAGNNTGGGSSGNTLFITGGVERMRITSAGGVGIGTASPAGALHVVTVGNNTTILDGSGVLANNVLQMRRNGGTAAQFGVANGAGNISALAGAINDTVLQTTAFGNNMIITNDVAGKDLIFGTAATERMRITSAGNVGIGTTAPNQPLQVIGVIRQTTGSNNIDINSGDRISFNAGTFYVLNGVSVGVNLANGATAWGAQSDARVKDNVRSLTLNLDKLEGLNPVTYRYTYDKDSIDRVGLIAQDVQKVLPQAVSTDSNGLLSVRYTELIPLLVGATRELNTKVNAQSLQIEKISGLVGLSQEDLNKIKADYLADVVAEQDNKFNAMKAEWDALRLEYESQKTTDASTTQSVGLALTAKLPKSDTTSTMTESDNSSTSSLSNKTFFDRLYSRLVIWFSDAANGIVDFFAKKIHTEQICLKKADGSEYCVNGDDLETIMQDRGEIVPTKSSSPEQKSTNDRSVEQVPVVESSVAGQAEQSLPIIENQESKLVDIASSTETTVEEASSTTETPSTEPAPKTTIESTSTEPALTNESTTTPTESEEVLDAH